MIAEKESLIVNELELGTGAAISSVAVLNGLRQGLRVWFSDLDEKHGPIAELRPYGLRGHQVRLFFGDFSGAVIRQIKDASYEDVQLSRALISSISADVGVEIKGQEISDWLVTDGSFQVTAKVRNPKYIDEDSEIVDVCREVIVPLMAAMAELIGYDIVEHLPIDDENNIEGAVAQSVVKRRERNPRNRLLCIRIHGEQCKVCGLEPKIVYGEFCSIIEVHHLEPLALLSSPRAYDPVTDLVPLCPNCHRAVHKKRPIPFTVEELKDLMAAQND